MVAASLPWCPSCQAKCKTPTQRCWRSKRTQLPGQDESALPARPELCCSFTLVLSASRRGRGHGGQQPGTVLPSWGWSTALVGQHGKGAAWRGSRGAGGHWGWSRPQLRAAFGQTSAEAETHALQERGSCCKSGGPALSQSSCFTCTFPHPWGPSTGITHVGGSRDRCPRTLRSPAHRCPSAAAGAWLVPLRREQSLCLAGGWRQRHGGQRWSQGGQQAPRAPPRGAAAQALLLASASQAAAAVGRGAAGRVAGVLLGCSVCL